MLGRSGMNEVSGSSATSERSWVRTAGRLVQRVQIPAGVEGRPQDALGAPAQGIHRRQAGVRHAQYVQQKLDPTLPEALAFLNLCETPDLCKSTTCAFHMQMQPSIFEEKVTLRGSIAAQGWDSTDLNHFTSRYSDSSTTH